MLTKDISRMSVRGGPSVGAIQKLKRRIGGRLFMPGESEYEAARARSKSLGRRLWPGRAYKAAVLRLGETVSRPFLAGY